MKNWNKFNINWCCIYCFKKKKLKFGGENEK